MEINAHTRLLHAKVDEAERFATMLLSAKLEAEEEQAFQDLVRKLLLPGVEYARKQLDQVAAQAAGKMKAWALVHLRQAQQLGRDQQLFEKILNDPLRTARQLVMHLMGVGSSKAKAVEEKQIDNVLDGLTF